MKPEQKAKLEDCLFVAIQEDNLDLIVSWLEQLFDRVVYLEGMHNTRCDYQKDGVQCPHPSEIDCRIGTCSPGRNLCLYHYGQVHLPTDEQDEIDEVLGGVRNADTDIR